MRRRRILLSILVFTVFLNLIPQGFAWVDDWDYRITITVDASKTAQDLVNYPLLIRLSTSSGLNGTDESHIFSILRSMYYHIAITDVNDTRLYWDVEYWTDTFETGYIWVRVPFISSSENTTLYLYYDALKDGSDYLDASQVWAGFGFASYMNDDPDNTMIADLTDNNNDGYKTSAGNPLEANGQLAKSQYFSSDYIDLQTWNNTVNYSNMTFLSWCRSPAYTGSTRVPYDFGYWVSPYGWLDQMSSGSNYHFIYLKNTGGTSISQSISFTPNTWHLIGFMWNGTYLFTVKDGVQSGVGSFSGTLGMSAYWQRFGMNGYSGESFDGFIDHTTFIEMDRSQAWTMADYYSQTDTYLYFDAPAEYVEGFGAYLGFAVIALIFALFALVVALAR